MANTTAQDRLNQLFFNQALPPAPTPGQPHFSAKELEQREAKDQQPLRIPGTAQYPRETKSPKKQQPQRDPLILTSSDDDDDYVSAFKQKPSMKPPPKISQPKASFGENPKDVVTAPNGPIQYLAKGKISKSEPFWTVNEHSDSDNEALPTADRKGNPVVGHFCQFALAAKFPYKYMNDVNDRVSRHFFASNKFYNRTWDLHYLHPPLGLSARPIILVPHAQVQELIREIGEAFKIPVSVPGFPFTLTFYKDGTPKPQYLGQTHSREEAQEIKNRIPEAPPDHGECPHDASPETKQLFKDFEDKCQAAIVAAARTKGGRGKKKREDDRLVSVRDWYVQLRRAQRYMGLRRKTGQIQQPDPNMPWDEQEKFRLQQLKTAHFISNPLDLRAPVPHPFEAEVVFIAVDVEAYERAHNLITEIGISTLDTLDLVNIPPGLNGKNWMDQIRSRHFRISGREHLVNKDFCIGHPNSFQFGRSEWVDLKDAVTKVESCFEWPFSVDHKHPSLVDPWGVEPANPAKENKACEATSTSFAGVSMGPTNAEQDAANRAAVASVLYGIGDQDAIKHAITLAETIKPGTENLQRGSKERNVILVGHDIGTDLAYLKDLGSKMFTPSRATYPIAAMDIMANGEGGSKTLASIIESLDTAPLYRILKEETQHRNLASIMKDLGLPCYFPHNGGNDARYTLEALIAMLIKARLKDDKEQKKEADTERRQKSGWNDSWNQDLAANDDPGRPHSPDDRQRKTGNLDPFEAAILDSPGSEASPRRQRDETIAAVVERLKLDTTIDEEQPKRRFH
ncbi:uncharacterized protein Z520_08592 [Fonsecaea multimorphosa CBS 102226]|uniref:Gfd2/YDR514C-like C-terminal domain-containing protein n=1 Tax=Fonsecaea multimorphosa CBS 102226 TaxID=1442371 RepID=A0A0D2JZA5_9EURO|nr:uncharacterized protein Z520_08592 [Fonsecaea multimorphosa CBS 102226]KIX95884.1 hypothetical protein Z520_08592 [Fonsecaea multimorphosa CBS 102226]OAL21616.1 hypothetical protein AYO22_08012 [Fonsecaea multimorphosa]